MDEPRAIDLPSPLLARPSISPLALLLATVCFATGVAAWATDEPPRRAPRPVDTVWPEDRQVRIDWRDGWDATLTANTERWKKEIERLERDRHRRTHRLGLRLVRLLQALIAKYPDEPDKHVDARRAMAEHLRDTGFRARACAVLRMLVDSVPGRPDTAAWACERILDLTPWDRPHETVDGHRWVAYAARRLLALHRAGVLPNSHPVVAKAHRAMVVACTAQGRWMDAADHLAELAASRDPGDWWRVAEADLLRAAGRGEEAAERLHGIQANGQASFVREFRSRVSERVRHITQSGPDTPPTYPGGVGLEVRWDAVRGHPLAETADRVATLVQEDAAGGNLVPWGEWRHTSLWAAVDRHVASRPPAEVGPLRTASQAKAVRRLRTAQRSGGQAARLAVYRSHPWTAAGCQALLEYGETALRRGQAGLALRAFADALSHTPDAGVRAKAQVGLWLTAAQLPNARAAVAAAFQGIDPEARYPWMGRPTPARAIRGCLLDGAAGAVEAAPLSLAALDLRAVQAPAVSPWPWEVFDCDMADGLLGALAPLPVALHLGDNGVVLAGPQMLCGYGGDLARPRWVRRPRVMTGVRGHREELRGRGLTVPGAFRPALADGRLVTRWGLESTRRRLTDVAAFDAATGRMLWCTAGDAAWGNTWPVGDPAVADGRVYVLATPRARARVLPVVPIDLVCLDADSGAVLWRRRLASQNLALSVGGYGPFHDVSFDLLHYGNAVTVHSGAVYCSTNLGFVARCDARDGAVEWTRTYHRVSLGHNVPRVMRRLGAAPVVVGERVVFAPRDRVGVFAVDRATGKLAWDNPFVASDEVVGIAGAALLLRDRQCVAALDVATGRTRWHRRFAEPLLGRPALAGSAVVAGTAAGLESLDAASGRLLEQRAWGQGGPMRSCVVRGRVLAGLADPPATSRRPTSPKPLNPKAPAAPAPLRLPLKRSWTLARPNPTLIVPPPEAKLDARVCVLSEGVLECVRLTPQGAVEWRTPVAPGFKSRTWAGRTLLFVYAQRVVAVDAGSGATRWQTAVPFVIRTWALAGPRLVLGAFAYRHRTRHTAAVDLASGKVLWERHFQGFGGAWESYLRHIGWDGTHIHLIGQLRHGDRGCYDLVCNPSTGELVAIRQFLPKGQECPQRLLFAGGTAFALDRRKRVHELSLAGGEPRAYRANLHDLNPDYLRPLRLTGQWLTVRHHQRDRDIQWVLRRGHPAYEFRRDRPGVIRGEHGDLLYEPAARTLTAFHLPTKQQRAVYTVPPTRGFYNRVLEFAEQGDTVLAVSGLDDGPHWKRRPARLRIDTFDRRTARHQAGQVVPHVPHWQYVVRKNWRDHTTYHTQLAIGRGTVALTSLHGLHAFVPATPADDLPPRLAYRGPRPVCVDGSLDEWDAQAGLALHRHGSSRADGTVRLAHDDHALHLAVAYTNADARPRRGRGHTGGGDWLEVGITVGTASHRFGIGLDDRGRVVWEPLGHRGLPKGIDGQVGGDPARRRTVYELTIPFASIVPDDHRGPLARFGLSLAVWDAPAPVEGSARVLTFGTALAGQSTVPLGHERVVLHPLTRDAEQAGMAIAEALPQLPTAWVFFRRVCRIHAADRVKVVALHRRILARRPRGEAALRTLVHLDQMLRTRLHADPSPEVLKLAAAQRAVPRPVRDHYRRLTRTHLSQWVHLDPKAPPRSLMIQLHDGQRRYGDEHRVFWGDAVWRYGIPGTPSRRDAGALPPAGAWHELRVPLIWLGLHRTPIHGIGFHQRGGQGVVWDRTAFVGEGKERVLIDDKPPEGRTRGGWHWVGKPVRSGTRALAERRRISDRDTASREVTELKAPVVEHLLPPLDGPTLSQWVYIDPDRRPKMVAIRLHDGHDWRALHVWGEPTRDSQFEGPLPPAGAWHELRLPLARTALGHLPIRGIAFAHTGGRVVWDRTALVVDGRHQVLVDDEMPPGRAEGSTCEWVDQPVKSGAKAHTHRPSGGYRSHGIYRLGTPVVGHLPFAPEQAIATLTEHIPRLGPTDVAWDLFGDLLALDTPAPPRRIARYTWFLRQFPTHARGAEVLKRLLDYHRAAEHPDPVGAVEAIIAACRPPHATRYAYRRRCIRTADTFVRTWQMLGPFPNPEGKGMATPYPPETEPIDLTRDYDGAGGKVRWKAHASAEPKIDLKAVFQPTENVVGYAACWVYSDRRRAARLELGSDDGCRVWLNRKVILSKPEPRSASPRQDVVPISLPRGWSELLVKVGQTTGEWELYVELIDPEGLSLLPAVRLSTRPPASALSKPKR